MIKKTVFLFCFVIAAAAFSDVLGQTNVPTPADNADPRDTNIKMRSVDLERVERDAAVKNKKSSKPEESPARDEMTAKFPQIKEDFEGIQLAQTAIIKAYTGGDKIDYAEIENSSKSINEKAKRLDSNLFASLAEPKNEATKEKKQPEEKPKAVRDLIVELDEAIGKFSSSKIFANLNVINAEDAVAARADLLKIQDLSEKLAAEAKKMQ